MPCGIAKKRIIDDGYRCIVICNIPFFDSILDSLMSNINSLVGSEYAV